jgi:predicted nucleic acid-binding protein
MIGKMRKVISNTTPIITLLTISKLELLKDIYGQIIIPMGVYEEIEEGRFKKFYADLSKIEWIEIKTITDRTPFKYLTDLDKGEAEVIVLANEISADLVIIDERLGRAFAEQFNLTVTGTIGILLKAKELDFIPVIKPMLEAMIENGIWLNKKLVDKILKVAGE